MPMLPATTEPELDAIVIGSGPNGLAAAIELARNGASVLVVEGSPTIGGGTRTQELTLPGFTHDVCSGCHPTGILSPFFRQLPLHEHGLTWLQSEVSVAHPLDEGPAVLLKRSVADTAGQLGLDGDRYASLVQPFLERPHDLFAGALGPLRIPKHPLLMARFGLHAWRSASGLSRGRFRDPRTRALLAGCAAHATLPLDTPLTAAMTMVFLISAHVENWPVAQGGSAAISAALASYFQSLGGAIETGRFITSLDELPSSRVVV
ncbi:MAG: phytoene desaturase family protein, partial [Myxococcota bacterium]